VVTAVQVKQVEPVEMEGHVLSLPVTQMDVAQTEEMEEMLTEEMEEMLTVMAADFKLSFIF
jgi:hypothetical protein